MDLLEDVATAEDKAYEVEAIVGKRIRYGQIEYLVKWTRLAECDNSWEPVNNLNCPKLIGTFEQANGTPTVLADSATNQQSPSSVQQKRPRGRPRRSAQVETRPPTTPGGPRKKSMEENTSGAEEPVSVKRPRGRPRKSDGGAMAQSDSNVSGNGQGQGVIDGVQSDVSVSEADNGMADDGDSPSKKQDDNNIEGVTGVRRMNGMVHYQVRYVDDNKPSAWIPSDQLLHEATAKMMVKFYERHWQFDETMEDESEHGEEAGDVMAIEMPVSRLNE